jgi:hypothetical protein
MYTTIINYKEDNKEPIEDLYFYAVTMAGLNIIPLLFGIQHIFNIFYASHNKRKYNPYGTLNLIDLGIFVLCFSNIMNTFAYNMRGTWNERLPADERAQIYNRNLADEAVRESVIWTFTIIILWIRVFYLLRYNEYMGKFIIVV